MTFNKKVEDTLVITLLSPGKIVYYYIKKTSRYCSADVIFGSQKYLFPSREILKIYVISTVLTKE
jgi:hypothetical protein